MPDPAPGRPGLDTATIRRRLVDATNALHNRGQAVTMDGLAELLDVTPRTVRRWREAVE